MALAKPQVVEIPLTQEKVARISDKHLERVLKYLWYAKWDKGKWYAAAKINGREVYLHKFILDSKTGMIDHADGDTLNCVDENLRIADSSQNRQNARPYTGGTSKYKGVCWYPNALKWLARITVRGRRISLGYFTDEVEAARAYDRAAIKHFGEFARLNFPLEDYVGVGV